MTWITEYPIPSTEKYGTSPGVSNGITATGTLQLCNAQPNLYSLQREMAYICHMPTVALPLTYIIPLKLPVLI